LFYRLMADRSALLNAGKGGTQSNISQTILRDWKVPVPPLNKQRAAVLYLDRALSVLGATEVALAEVDARCTALRRSILKAAFEGRLTAGGGTARWSDKALKEIA
jgi:type I restriction enzyme S subunit